MAIRNAVVLVNTGSPASYHTADVRRYLREFLSDPYVIDLPSFLRLPLVYGIIAPLRGPKSAQMYRSIWAPEGSPLLVHTRRLAEKIQKKIGKNAKVTWAMRYGAPSMESVLKGLKEEGVENLFCIPLFPQYALSTYESVSNRFYHLVRVARVAPDFQKTEIMEPYFDQEDYIEALYDLLKPGLKKGGYTLFSFHSLPERHLHKADPARNHCLKTPNCCETHSQAHATCYRAQALKTVELLARRAALSPGRYSVSFQSAMNGKWLGPATEDELVRLAKAGETHVTLMAPGFAADNLETLEELSIRAVQAFTGAGGKELKVIESLNSSPKWVDALSRRIAQQFSIQ